MESDVFYGAIKTNDHFYELEPKWMNSFSEKESHCVLLTGFDLIIWNGFNYQHTLFKGEGLLTMWEIETSI